MLKILISAAEASSDTHGAELLKQIRVAAGTEVIAYGVGGPKLQAQGLKTLVDARELLSMGFTEILGRLPRILRALGTIEAWAKKERPDVVVVIDYPDFHFRLAKKLQETGIPLVYYIPPKVWAWRTGRVAKLKALFSKVLCIFPFEKKFFSDHGLGVTYVGNPLLDELPLSLSRAQARAHFGLTEKDLVLAAMAGSRPTELKLHLELVLDASVRTAARLRELGKLGASDALKILLPLPVTASLESIRERLKNWERTQNRNGLIQVKLSQGDSAQAMVAADAGLIKSGTSTLEAAILGLPLVVLYRANFLTVFIFKYLIRYKGPVGLVNLVRGWKVGDPYVARELLGPFATVEALTDEATRLLTDDTYRGQMRAEFAKIRASLVTEGTPSARAAREVLSAVRSRKP